MPDSPIPYFENADRGTVHAGEPVHEMWLRLTIDDTFKIVAVEAATRRPALLDSCHVFASEVVKREWPEFYTGD